MTSCNGGTKQLFHLHDNGLIQHGPTNKCLGVKGPQLRLDPCDVTSSAQVWEFVVATPTNENQDSVYLIPN